MVFYFLLFLFFVQCERVICIVLGALKFTYLEVSLVPVKLKAGNYVFK